MKRSICNYHAIAICVEIIYVEQIYSGSWEDMVHYTVLSEKPNGSPGIDNSQTWTTSDTERRQIKQTTKQ
jgi:hypothetical protein